MQDVYQKTNGMDLTSEDIEYVAKYTERTMQRLSRLRIMREYDHIQNTS